MSASAFLSCEETSIPSRKYRPEVIRSRQPSMFMKVDLPLPLAPMMATNSPRWISTLTPRNACTRVSPSSYYLCASSTRMTALAAEAGGTAPGWLTEGNDYMGDIDLNWPLSAVGCREPDSSTLPTE